MQDYKLMFFEKGDFQDPYGNYWCNAAFEGVSEPVRWVVKDPAKIQVGEPYYGEIKDETSKAGKPYRRFYKKPRPDAPQHTGSGNSRGAGVYRDNSDGMRQGMCFNNATLFVNMMVDEEKSKPSPAEWAELVFAHAQALYVMGDLKPKTPVEVPIEEHQTLSEMYQSKRLERTDEVAEYKDDEPINLDDIPF